MPGKGGAFVQVEMKDIKNGVKLNERFRSNEDVLKAHVDQKNYQFLYFDDRFVTLMDQENYEQIQLNKDLLGKNIKYLQENMILNVSFYQNDPIGVELPSSVVLKVVQTEPVVKGQTAASSYKPAELDNGMRIMVPPFIGEGDMIVVNTETDSYIERSR